MYCVFVFFLSPHVLVLCVCPWKRLRSQRLAWSQLSTEMCSCQSRSRYAFHFVFRQPPGIRCICVLPCLFSVLILNACRMRSLDFMCLWFCPCVVFRLSSCICRVLVSSTSVGVSRWPLWTRWNTILGLVCQRGWSPEKNSSRTTTERKKSLLPSSGVAITSAYPSRQQDLCVCLRTNQETPSV